MSLDARFTQLRRSTERSLPAPPAYQRNPSPRERVSSLKNRLLALEMAERPNVMAALSRGRPRLRRGGFNAGMNIPSFNGIPNFGRSRSPFPGGRSRTRQRSGSRRRSSSVGRIGRSQSLQSLMSIESDDFNFGRRSRARGIGGFRTRIFSRGSRISARGGIQKLQMDMVGTARRRRSASLNRLSNVMDLRRGRGNRGMLTGSGGLGIKSRLGIRSGSISRSSSLMNLNNIRGGNRGGRRGAARGGGRGRGAVRQRSASLPRRGRGAAGGFTPRGGARGGIRGRGGAKGARQNQNRSNRGGGQVRGGGGFRRGGMRGRGRGAGNRGGKKPTMPTKEELDSQLDQYMSNTRSYLDKQLDQYMTQPTAAT